MSPGAQSSVLLANQGLWSAYRWHTGGGSPCRGGGYCHRCVGEAPGAAVCAGPHPFYISAPWMKPLPNSSHRDWRAHTTSNRQVLQPSSPLLSLTTTTPAYLEFTCEILDTALSAATTGVSIHTRYLISSRELPWYQILWVSEIGAVCRQWHQSPVITHWRWHCHWQHTATTYTTDDGS